MIDEARHNHRGLLHIIRNNVLVHIKVRVMRPAVVIQRILNELEPWQAERIEGHARLDRNLGIVREFFARERRLEVVLPEGGNVVFPRLPPRVDSDAFAGRLLRKYSTLVVPGRFFEAPRHIRISFGCALALLQRGLENISRTLDRFRAEKETDF